MALPWASPIERSRPTWTGRFHRWLQRTGHEGGTPSNCRAAVGMTAPMRGALSALGARSSWRFLLPCWPVIAFGDSQASPAHPHHLTGSSRRRLGRHDLRRPASGEKAGDTRRSARCEVEAGNRLLSACFGPCPAHITGSRALPHRKLGRRGPARRRRHDAADTRS